ncbi:DUF6090 family protein [Winogradskyella sp. A3E31]|uniref:DUF6090 family protein n=1 Tax=Winogradskyella sp. A3E31 TaxID=3349637 RepID=UPI00398AD35B
METGKTSKYFKYAIGEIVLVVIGILIALQINTWNTNRINKDKEQEYLVGLKTDLESQIASFNGRLNIFDFIIDKAETIIFEFSVTGKLTEIDSINHKLNFMIYTLDYPEAKTTFNELNTTGQINLIRDKLIRSKIIAYYQYSEETKSQVSNNVEKVYYDQVFPIIKASVMINPEGLGFPLEKIDQELLKSRLNSEFENNLNNPVKAFEIVNAVSLHLIEMKTNKGFIILAKNAAEVLLKDIVAALNKQ